MTSIALLGAGGMLGHDIARVLEDADLTQFTRRDLDITDALAVSDALRDFDVVVNSAAYTHVDEAESHIDDASRANALGAENVASACVGHGRKLIHLSTDYVFDGLAAAAYAEDHPRDPQSVYGRTKAEGESKTVAANPNNTIIVRTAWLYGISGSNFVSTMLRLAESHDTVSVVTDQVGQPTWSADVAAMIRELIASPVRAGIFHATNSGQASWFEFAQKIFRTAGLDVARVLPTTTKDFQRPAPRPAWSVLGHENWKRHGFEAPRPWSEAFEEAWDRDFSPNAEAKTTAE